MKLAREKLLELICEQGKSPRDACEELGLGPGDYLLLRKEDRAFAEQVDRELQSRPRSFRTSRRKKRQLGLLRRGS